MDIAAMLTSILLTYLLSAGVEMSARVNNILNVLNSAVWLLFLSASAVLGNRNNVNKEGVAPFGFTGVRIL